jgi:hypothetical protein
MSKTRARSFISSESPDLKFRVTLLYNKIHLPVIAEEGN